MNGCDLSGFQIADFARGVAPRRAILTRPLPAGSCETVSSKLYGARRLMRIRPLATIVCLFAGLCAASPAAAQYGARAMGSDRATGETYHVEFGGSFWNPTPTISIASESLGIAGDAVDFVNDLGIDKTTFKQLKVVLRPATKHKFRFEYTPISYTAESNVTRTFVFNGQRFTIGLPVATELEWKAYRFGYEWDFAYLDRGFVGMLLEMKYTDVNATLASPLVGLDEFAEAKAPIPAIGVIGRGYVAPNISITGEFSFFKLPDAAADPDKYGGNYYDFDLYGTVNFTDHFGAQVGYRSLDVYYKVKLDQGNMTLKGPYFGGVVRF